MPRINLHVSESVCVKGVLQIPFKCKFPMWSQDQQRPDLHVSEHVCVKGVLQIPFKCKVSLVKPGSTET